MSAIEAAVHRYFDAWNANDGAAVAACFVPDGTLHDAITGGPVGPDLMPLFVQGLFDAFPDAALPIDAINVVAPDKAMVEFRTTGTNTADSIFGPATNLAVDHPGVDVISYDEDADALRSVRGYWDLAGLFEQVGLQLNPSPKGVPGLLDFGLGVRVHTGQTAEPGCFTVTSTDAAGDDANWVPPTTEGIVTDLMGMPGYLGSVFANAGGRFYTFSAWESPEAVQALRSTSHAEAMRAMLTGERCTRIMTSLWVPHKLNVTKAGPAGGERPTPVTEPEQWL
jgi:hypothetical protein